MSLFLHFICLFESFPILSIFISEILQIELSDQVRMHDVYFGTSKTFLVGFDQN